MAKSKSQARRLKIQEEPVSAAGEVETFVRIKRHRLKSGDHFEAFQPELIRLRDGQIIERKLVSKPDVFEMAFAIGADMIDPRNDEKPIDAPI